MLLYIVMAAFGLAVCGLCIASRYADVHTVRKYARRTVRFFAFAGFAVCLVAVCIMCCYSSVVGYLKATLPGGMVEWLKTAVKVLFGGGSTFSALQTLIIFSFMLGFLSCTVLGVGGFVFICICRRKVRGGCVGREQRLKRTVCSNYVNRSFLVYERYNS